MADNWNKMKNMASKVIGEKMKVREKSCYKTVASAKNCQGHGDVKLILMRICKRIVPNEIRRTRARSPMLRQSTPST